MEKQADHYSINTEQAILEAARKVFIEKGMEGARMQEIADEAGINKALLHYYFRSKEKLFHAIFLEAFQKFLPQVASTLSSDLPFPDKLEHFIEQYITMILENPHIPGFVLHELSRNPQNLAALFKQHASMIPGFVGQIQDEIDKGNLVPGDPKQILVNTLALCIFPFVASPIIREAFFGGDAQSFREFLEMRKQHVFTFIKRAIIIEKP